MTEQKQTEQTKNHSAGPSSQQGITGGARYGAERKTDGLLGSFTA
jgi:hypothetical protein